MLGALILLFSIKTTFFLGLIFRSLARFVALVPSPFLHVTNQIEPQPKTATELLAEEQAAAAVPSESAQPDFAPQPAGSNNPFGASAFGGAGPAGAYAQVRVCPPPAHADARNSFGQSVCLS